MMQEKGKIFECFTRIMRIRIERNTVKRIRLRNMEGKPEGYPFIIRYTPRCAE